MDSENLSSLIRLSLSDGQKTDSSIVVSVIYNKGLYRENVKIFLSETTGPRALIFGM